jgi:DNA polymerase (family 10)
MKNLELAQMFRNIANILEIKGGNVFRIRAYERAAQNIESLSQDIEEFVKEERLLEIPGIGRDLSERVREFIKTGKIKIYQDLKLSIPAGLLDLLNIPSVGPKTAKLLYEKLKIKSVSDLEKAILKNKLKGIFGIKEKTIENISKGIEILKRGRERMNLAEATLLAQDFLAPLKKLPQVKNISLAGSLRRQKETVRDIDILVASDKPKKIVDAFVSLPIVKDILAHGPTKASVRTKNDVQADCRVVEEKSFGAALIYFTGSKNFNIKLRRIAIKKGLKVNEYGIFKGSRAIAGSSEEEAFKALGMRYIPAELREDTGEVELAQINRLPRLIELKDIKGDLHTHSLWSDGRNNILEMAKAAKNLGYEYIAVTDHSQSLKIANGLSIADLKNKKREIEQVNKKIRGWRVLFGTEVDIDSQGKIDYKDEILKQFDIVVAAIHTGFKQSRQQLTKRAVRACLNRYVHIIAHPTARLWGLREPYAIDLEEVFQAAADTNTQLEINAFPNRLDLNDSGCRRAKEKGARLAIGTDSHSKEQMESMKLGISVARRGWLSRHDVINTLPLEKLLKAIKK